MNRLSGIDTHPQIDSQFPTWNPIEPYPEAELVALILVLSGTQNCVPPREYDWAKERRVSERDARGGTWDMGRGTRDADDAGR
jgi:hypothetical protein